ncbi:MAG: murein biosynthesis integral membrane protein MurJ [Propionibacteriales bacterium]|nr:murein biosynthesis integral membrane protein MurJ [Propionibacteriales bacterium]
MSDSLLRSSAVMAAGTVVSRLTGFVRGAMLAAAIGLGGLHADLFTLANTVPNMLYILVAGGVFNAVLVPQIVRAMKQDADGGEAYVNRILTLSGLFLAGVTAVLVVIAPAVMYAVTRGGLFVDGLQEQRDSLVTLARYCLPQVFFYGVFVLMGQVLNARGRFGPMMWAPIANNLVSIAVIGVYLWVYGASQGNHAYTSGEELLLGLGSTAGIVVQAILLVPYLRAAGVRYRPRFDFVGTGLMHTLRLAVWTVLFVVANQIAYVVVISLATDATASGALAGEEGSGVTVYSNAFLLVMVPHAIVTVSLATATLPRLSALAADGRRDEVRSEIATTVRHALAVILPFCVLLAVIAPALAVILFGWGAAAGGTDVLALTLMAFAPGLLFFTLHYLMLRGFYAQENTRTPFFIQLVVSATNIVAAVGITSAVETRDIAPLLALAYGCAYLVGSVVSVTVLGRRTGGTPLVGVPRYAGAVLLAAVPSTLAAWAVVRALAALGVDSGSRSGALLELTTAGLVAVAIFGVLARLLHIAEVTGVMTTAFGRLRRTRPRT